MKQRFQNFLSNFKVLLNKAVELSSFEYFDDDICQSELDEYWCSFAYETA